MSVYRVQYVGGPEDGRTELRHDCPDYLELPQLKDDPYPLEPLPEGVPPYLEYQLIVYRRRRLTNGAIAYEYVPHE